MRFLCLFFVAIYSMEGSDASGCDDVVVLNGPKELAIAICVSLLVGFALGFIAKPTVAFVKRKMAPSAWDESMGFS